MAIGDDAVAAGMPLVLSTDLVKDGPDHHNLTRDLIAQRTSAVLPISKGGTGKTNAGAARIALGAAAASHTHAPNQISPGDLDLGPGGMLLAGQGIESYGARFNVISGGATAVLSSIGRLGVASSSRRFKQDEQEWNPERDAVLAMRVVRFRYIEQVEEHGDQAPVEVGVIAEDLVALGLDWLVFRDDAGQPMGVHYDRIALALVGLVQDHEARIAALENKGD